MQIPKARESRAPILVVDDEQLIRWSVKQRLEQAGYEVRVADSGRETMESLKDPFCLILLDLKLPDASGLDLLREIRSRQPRCRIVMISAHWTAETASEALREGACGILHKPFRLDDVARTIEAALA